jgi:beta-aspartyl-peptidase (threonine type)
MTPARHVLVVHGGVETPESSRNQIEVGRAARVGGEALALSGLDAVERAIDVLETAPGFNAGYGAVLNELGEIELDALIVDGASGRAGAVAAIQGVVHPVSVARLVLETTSSVLIVGAGATRFARQRGIPIQNCESREQRRAWKRALARGTASLAGLHPFTGQSTWATAGDTVGAVAATESGTAAGVSSGGIFLKTAGRVGDSAIPGAGAWASPSGAAAGTGLGEAFIELQLARRVVTRLEQGVHPQDAVDEALVTLYRHYSAVGGLIAVDAHGQIGAAHTGNCMPVSAFDLDSGKHQTITAARVQT